MQGLRVGDSGLGGFGLLFFDFLGFGALGF